MSTAMGGRRTLLLALLFAAGGALAVGCGGGSSASSGGRVTVRVPALSAPGTYAIVVSDSAGRLVSSTAVTGSASSVIAVPHEGMVSFAAALAATNFSINLATVVSPPAGATIQFRDPFVGALASPTPTPGAQTWNVSLTPVSGATGYDVYGPCSSFQGSLITPIPVTTQSCPGVTSGKILAVARGGSGQPIAWHRTALLPAAPGGSTNIAIELDHTDIVHVDAYQTDLPAGTLGMFVGFTDDDPAYAPGAIGYEFGGSSSVPEGGTAAVAAFAYPNLGPVVVNETAVGNTGNITRVRTLASPPGAVAFDLQGLALPTAPFFDGPSGTIAWQMPLFGFGQTLTMRLFDAPTNGEFDVTAILPPGLSSFQIPVLPPEFVPPVALESLAGYGFANAPDVAGVASYSDYILQAGGLPDYVFYGMDGVFLAGQLII